MKYNPYLALLLLFWHGFVSAVPRKDGFFLFSHMFNYLLPLRTLLPHFIFQRIIQFLLTGGVFFCKPYSSIFHLCSLASDQSSFLLSLGALSIYNFDQWVHAFTAAAFSLQSACAASPVHLAPRLGWLCSSLAPSCVSQAAPWVHE